MARKSLTIGIITLFLFCNISFTTLSDENSVNLSGKTLYVGGSGPGNYTKIQDATDDSSDGDTIFVFSGNYYGNIVIDKSINLIGQDIKETIIQSNGTDSAIDIKMQNVTLEGFTIQGGKCGIRIYEDTGVRYIDHVVIKNNIIKNHEDSGILFLTSRYSSVLNNSISNCKYGINFALFHHGTIRNNKISSNSVAGIKSALQQTPGDWISYNIIENNEISNSYYGMNFYSIGYNQINKNNFKNNKIDATFVSFFKINNWNFNYWNRPRLFPKPIIGISYFGIPWINFDWFPAKEPYEI